MAHSFSNLLYHAVFSTKDRVPMIDRELADRLFPYLGGIVKELKGIPFIINGPADHVHMLIRFPATLAVADAMRVIKTNSSRWVGEMWPKRGFAWQTGYAAFTVSQSSRESVRQYIARQEEHHRAVTFQEEFIMFLKKHEIEYDERYIWD